MNTKLTAFVLISLSIIIVGLYPEYTQGNSPVKPVEHFPVSKKRIDAVFVLDTTGSMGGLIQAAKEKIWSIASTLASEQSSPEIRVGLIAYRDRGDDYITQVIDLSGDLDTLNATLMDFQAKGGGDSPESVNQALHDAVHNISWSNDTDAYKVIFLVGDAPPHMDYQDDVKYPLTLTQAAQKGIVVNTIQCGSDSAATTAWQQVAQLGRGQYFQVEQAGNAVTVKTPYDKKLAKLSADLDSTRLYYGSVKDKARQKQKMDATNKLNSLASPESLARRATFNTSKSGSGNLLGKGELVDEIASGRRDLSEIDSELLPKPMQAMTPDQRQLHIETKAARRETLKKQIKTIADKRSRYLEKEIAEAGGAENSLDQKLYDVVRMQGTSRGLIFDSDRPAY